METAGKLVDDEELKEALKERGLGTPATRASIIETLLERGYIAREKKALVATDLGRYLVALVQDRELKSPELTGEWEAKLREIERGQLDPRQFMREIARYTGDIIRSGDGDHDRPGPARRLPALRPSGHRGQAGFGCSGWREGCPFVLWPEFRGRTLGDEEVRELLQRRVLFGPPGAREQARWSSTSPTRARSRRFRCRPAGRRERLGGGASGHRSEEGAEDRPARGTPRPT